MLSAPVKQVMRLTTSLPKTVNSSPPMYKLLLHREKYQMDKYVTKVLTNAIKDMTLEEADMKMTEAKLRGVSILRIYPQEIAEDKCERIRFNAVKATIEPVK